MVILPNAVGEFTRFTVCIPVYLYFIYVAIDVIYHFLSSSCGQGARTMNASKKFIVAVTTGNGSKTRSGVSGNTVMVM